MPIQESTGVIGMIDLLVADPGHAVTLTVTPLLAARARGSGIWKGAG